MLTMFWGICSEFVAEYPRQSSRHALPSSLRWCGRRTFDRRPLRSEQDGRAIVPGIRQPPVPIGFDVVRPRPLCAAARKQQPITGDIAPD